jgi:hypothetical protein
MVTGIDLRNIRMRYKLITINPDLNWRLRIYKGYKRLISDNNLDKSEFDFTHEIGYNGNYFERNHISLQVTATSKKLKQHLGSNRFN